MSTIPRVPAGIVAVELICPRCGVLETIPVALSAVLTTPSGEPATLRVKAKAKPLDHDCHPHGAPSTLFSVPTGEDIDQ